MFILIYLLSLVGCGMIFVFGLQAISLDYPYKGRKSKLPWFDFPFGGGPSILPGIAGFAFFPVINTLIIVGFLIWLACWLSEHETSLKDFCDAMFDE